MDTLIRHEAPNDRRAIGDVIRAAFGQVDEAQLVDALRAAGHVRLSLVAVRDAQVIGHVLFTQMWIDGDAHSVDALALAPMAVLPDYQRQGIGSTLVRRGLELCGEAGHRIVLVVGHPEYYPRFGFSREHAMRLESPYQGDAFMALELAPGALSGVTGAVRYAPPFADL